MFSWYEALTLPGLKFVDGKLSLNDYYSNLLYFNIGTYIIVVVCIVVTRH